MDTEAIRKYASVMKDLGLTALEVKENGTELRLEMNPSSAAVAPVAPAVSRQAEAPAQEHSPASGADGYVMTAPMVGVVYLSPAENAPAFVAEGSKIRKGDPMCIIEAMKLMNEIPAEEDGTVLEVLVKSGQIVEYGTPLFRIGRA